MGHLNVQGIQIKIEQIDLLLNSSINDIQLFGLSETKLNDSHTSNFFNIKNFQLFVKIGLFLLVDLNKGEELLSMWKMESSVRWE